MLIHRGQHQIEILKPTDFTLAVKLIAPYPTHYAHFLMPEEIDEFKIFIGEASTSLETTPEQILAHYGFGEETQEEPDYDNMARDYQDAQDWAAQPTPYDP